LDHVTIIICIVSCSTLVLTLNNQQGRVNCILYAEIYNGIIQLQFLMWEK